MLPVEEFVQIKNFHCGLEQLTFYFCIFCFSVCFSIVSPKHHFAMCFLCVTFNQYSAVVHSLPEPYHGEKILLKDKNKLMHIQDIVTLLQN